MTLEHLWQINNSSSQPHKMELLPLLSASLSLLPTYILFHPLWLPCRIDACLASTTVTSAARSLGLEKNLLAQDGMLALKNDAARHSSPSSKRILLRHYPSV
jgi:hypothetical protein